MVTQRNSTILTCVVTLAATLVMASTAMSATQEPTATPPKIEVTSMPHALEPKAPPASDQKNAAKQEKKKGPITGMLLGVFAVITGQQGATR